MIFIDIRDISLSGEHSCRRTCQEGALILSKADGLNVRQINGCIDNCELGIRIAGCILGDVSAMLDEAPIIKS